MSYAAAIDALNALAPELFTQPGRPRRKFSVAEIGALLAALGNPHHRFPSVLIAGTNGKGSTAATLASILQASGLRTGLYTSPHLERPNERIRINGPVGVNQEGANQEISDSDFARRYFTVHDTAGRLVESGQLAQFPSFFETLTAMAFLHFAEAPVDIAVLEVGMGGRLDATNIVDPLLSVITDISLDHTEWLGPTISAIAREKAGILRRAGTLITLPQHSEANQAIGEVAAELNVRGISATAYMPPANASPDTPYTVDVLAATIQVDSPLHGAHQHRNIALAIAAAAELAQCHGLPVTPQSIASGIHATQWPGRLEQIRIGRAVWVLDVAHNPAGAWALRAGLRPIFDAAPAHPRTLVFACLRDKPLPELAQILFPLFDRIVFAPIHSPRAAGMEPLLAAAHSTGTPAQAAESVAAALELARPCGEGLVVVSGSVYLVGDARALLIRESLKAGSAQP
jgi:dihydrofolate synthase/folylpolyglutamate synthase